MVARRSIGVGGLEISDRAKEYVRTVLDSNRLSYGPFSERFEALFASVHSCRHAIFCSSGTSALHMALAALKDRHGWRDGDEVVVPASTFVATHNIVHHCRMTARFVDVEMHTYNLDPTRLEAVITPNTRAVIPVHLMGLPADMDPIREIAARHDLRIIEDSCETMFARYRGNPVGSLGDIGTFSTYVAHFIVAGIGGFATTNDDDLAIRMRSYMNHGRDPIYLRIDSDQNVSSEALHEIVRRRFSFITVGHNFRCTELEAAIGLAQLEDRDYIVARRRAVADQLTAGLSDLQEHLQLPSTPQDRDHMFMLYPLVLRGPGKRPFVNHLEDRGIETRDLMPLVDQPVIRSIHGDIEGQYPVAKLLNNNGLYIGCHQYMTDDDVEFVVATIREYFRR